MWIVRLALRRPYTVAVLCFALLLFGALGIRSMRTDIFPVIDIPVVVVVWSYPGMSAEDMERRVVILSERAYSTTVDGISHIESQSMTGIGILKIYFEPGADIGGAIAQITSVSQTASHFMPPGILLPSIVRYNASNVPVAQLAVSSQKLTEEQLFDYALNFIRVRLFTVPGLATPAPYGGKQRQIMVDIDPAKATAHGMSTEDVLTALLGSNLILPGGTARMGTTDYDVLMNSSPTAIADFERIPLRTVGGATVTIGDVARVHDGFAVQQNIVRVNGQRATYLAILKKASASTIAVVDAAREAIPLIKATAPEGMEIKLEFDQSVFVRAAIDGVLKEAVIASLLVSVMIFFFLGSVRSVVIVSTSIPLAIFASLGGLYLTGQTLNIMTLGGLSLAIGMLVDDATVAVENIHRNRALGKPLMVAVLDGSYEIATPALAATLTICIVFLPVFLLVGPTRFMFFPLALSVVFAMLASYVLSRTLVPMLSRLLLEKERHEGAGLLHRFNATRDRAFDAFRDRYVRALELALEHRAFVLFCGASVVALAVLLPRAVGLDFFPAVDAGQMRLHVRAPIGTRIEETEHVVGGVEQTIRDIVGPKDLGTINDNIGIPTSYNLAFVQTDNIGGQDADVLVTLNEGHAPTAAYRRKIRERLAERFPGVSFYFQPADIIAQVLNFGIAAPIDVEIEGKELEQSMSYARKLREDVRSIPGAVDVRIPQVLSHPALFVDVDRERASRIGIQQRDVANDVLTSLSSSSLVAPSFWLNPKNGVNYFVVVQTPLAKVESVDELRATPITGAASYGQSGAPGASLPPYLGAIATIKPTQSMSLVSHDAVQRVVDVQLGVEGRDLGAVSADVDKAIRSLGKLPAGTRVNVRGKSESMRSSFRSLGFGLILATLLVYLLLVVLYQSWLDPFIILFAVPGAIVGVLWMLAATGTTLNVESLMGTIMSVGVAVSNSILLVNFANELRAQTEMDPAAAALEAGKVRLRPVLMTALAMVLGMIPMASGLGEGGEQNAPLGRAVIGGLVFATFTTLFFVPIVYSLLRKRPPTKHRLDERFALESAGA
ncbi:MAG TPA: efflux RND transporter permease subunit, partial [Polyangiaceae bacterium]|nr:efflux RND transporter permease subunit [Polyangiaceae bacterium]